MKRTDTIIIGGGQAGLAMSRCLSDLDIDHVVLERGRIAERWRSERWDSLRLLTPNWQTRLPGYAYSGPSPDDFMSMPELLRFFDDYARSFAAPIETDTSVLSLTKPDDEFDVLTTRGSWRAPNVVVATGFSDRALVPAVAAGLTADVEHITPSRYRNPARLSAGGVLVVGASASGVQLAEEIHQSGRPVTLAVGRHTRLPRSYRGRDIFWWMDRMGVFDQKIDDVFDAEVSRHQPSLQLVGRPDHRSLGLNELQAIGVRLVGRLVGASGGRVTFDDSLVATAASADLKLASLRQRVDAFIESSGLGGFAPAADPLVPSWPIGMASPARTLDLRAEGISTVLWATGFRREYPWLHVPVFDGRGEIAHVGGVTPADGLFALGLHFQRRRKSAFIDGVGDDAKELAGRIARRLRRDGMAAA